MEQSPAGRQRFAQANANQFAEAVTDLNTALPTPDSPTIRITLTHVDTGQHLKDVDIDAVNLWRLASAAHHRAARARETAVLAPASERHLHVVGGSK
jgi:hypothetical protein